jgi:hypothetical protein
MMGRIFLSAMLREVQKLHPIIDAIEKERK